MKQNDIESKSLPFQTSDLGNVMWIVLFVVEVFENDRKVFD